MIEVIQFEAHHARLIRPQAAQVSEVNAQSLASPYGMAWTAVVDGLPIACAGLVELWPGRAYAWALLDIDAGKHLLPLTREIRSRLSATPFRRIEMAVDAGFEEGCRWARLLGFEREGLARSYLPNGRDAWIYANVLRPVHDGSDGRRYGGGRQHLPGQLASRGIRDAGQAS